MVYNILQPNIKYIVELLYTSTQNTTQYSYKSVHDIEGGETAETILQFRV